MEIIALENEHIYQSTSLNRGVATFTSFLSDKTQFIFLDDHLERLLKGADFLFPQVKWSAQKNQIKAYLQGKFEANHYFRLTISDDQILFSKRAHMPKEPFVTVAKAQSAKVTSIIPAFVKAPDYKLAELEIRNAKKDVLFFDTQGNLTEASTSNVFVVLDEKTILTPKTSSMVLEGVTRKNLVSYLKQNQFNVLECDISQSELESAREIWLTNSIQGIRLVDRFEKLDFFKDKTIYQDVCHKFGRFGEKFNHE